MTSSQLYRRLLTYLRPHWRLVSVALLAMGVIAALEPMLPALMQPLVDDSLIAKDKQAMLWVPLALLAVFVVKGLAEYVASVVSQGVAQRTMADLRSAMFAKMMTLPIDKQQQIGSANLLSRVTFDVTQVATALSEVWIVIIRDTLIILGLVGFLLYTSWQLTLFIIAIAPIASWIIRKASGLMRTSSSEVQASMGRVTQILDEALSGRKEISIYAGQAHEQARFNRAVDQLRQQTMSIVKVASANVPLVQVIAAVAVACVIFVATHLSEQELLTPGQLIAFITGMSMLFEPIRRLTGINEPLQKGLAAATTIFALLDEVDEPDQGAQTLSNLMPADIKLQALSFTYPEQTNPAIQPLDLLIPAGKTLALVGASGSGKSTLISLLCRFNEPTSGQIVYGDTPIHQLTLANWREQIALVSQHIVLFDDSIAANIAYGELVTPDNRPAIEAAARAAHAWEFIRQLPAGLDTAVGEDGTRLSGGQRQRLALARAFYKNAPILILDEATSALDTESEQLISQALRELQGQKTIIIIAHRLSTVQHSDLIVLLERGELREQGNHHQLLAQGGSYANLVAHSELK
ncbi:MAG TPA: lipid A export permease/ATP-binding protein MsbA [Thiotrichales bacterium]|nr:MAG: lipid A export permease/ATP-binding protein MsbA [Thiotrichales bacterium 35-46-9]OYZ42808.1 MAG: lipid A export permease/ATP-binding protein MsbA [Thiotrichales bacterium 24-47-4]OZA74806.1 MAG: lipid A export permease/ATP-binding protein MsbA [Thiotrichales bacterium 39-47-5]HQR81810.1 lipid A export permease/ATP-binding protein MsbA [Thiotrichales bacterium]HQR94985.1 lipid A export permease/ATP-binding protein MsbA [Thiotrichales bacterium]